jgi:hypothetical protein
MANSHGPHGHSLLLVDGVHYHISCLGGSEARRQVVSRESGRQMGIESDYEKRLRELASAAYPGGGML